MEPPLLPEWGAPKMAAIQGPPAHAADLRPSTLTESGPGKFPGAALSCVPVHKHTGTCDHACAGKKKNASLNCLN